MLLLDVKKRLDFHLLEERILRVVELGLAQTTLNGIVKAYYLHMRYSIIWMTHRSC